MFSYYQRIKKLRGGLTTDYALELITKSKAGDAEAFGELYAMYSRELYGFALYMLRSKEDAEDAVQDAAIAAFRNLGSLKKPDSFKPWLFKILSNRCKTLLTGRKPDISSAEEGFLESLPDTSPGIYLPAELCQALEILGEEERRIVLMAVLGGFKSREIALVTDCPSATVRSKLARSLKKMRTYLETE